ncbi:MAG TPA: hypothetical protein VHR88_13395 [Solirubrobacteraceae bacterium]|nr:hypothetical protein [Solirubrobacteraceae bacterium]
MGKRVQRGKRVERRRRQARVVGAIGFLVALGLPIVLWHRAMELIAAAYTLKASYFTGLVPWLLMGAGLLFFVPVAWSAGRSPDSRWYPRARNAYAGWGITLYLLGFALATQVAQIQQHILQR